MAEVVAATAAIVQFVDVALRLSSCLERLFSDVRNVPRRFLQLQTDLRQQIEIAQRIQNDHVPGFATTVSPSALDPPLVEYISLAEELNKALEELLTRKNDGVLQRGWSGFCSSRKKEEVAHICDRLEQKRSVLSMWLNAANLKLSSETVATTDQIRVDIGQTLTLVKTVDKTSATAELNTARLLPHVQQIDRNVSTASERTERIIQDLQHLKSQSRSLLVDRDVNATAQESSRQTTAMVLSNTEQILRAIEKLGSDFDRASVGTRDGFAVGKQRVDSSDTRTQRSAMDRTSKPRRCRCRTVGTARRWQPLSILRFTRTFRAQHFSYCPDYRISEQSLEITMQLVPPIWLFSHTVNLSTHVRNWSTMGPFSISPIVVGTSRLVDPMTSPAFRAIARTIDELWDNGQHHVSIPRLQNTLQALFNDHEASALDTDSNGDTILNNITRIFVEFPAIVSCPGDEYISLIRFLLESGADPNVLRTSKPSDRSISYLDNAEGTICDLLTQPIAFRVSNSMFGDISEFLHILELVTDAGGHTSKPSGFEKISSTYKCSNFSREIQYLNIFEDQIDIWDLGDLVPMILLQDENQFRRVG
ncbi:hypothetical protein ACET3X_001114 [Alternaria dauci]|uniref:Fungal N-terminal domain-containing protein n=1 Tax=Alternaria dauci TaxID=48095 RepID=A0ABR3UWW5_9PLEO